MRSPWADPLVSEQSAEATPATPPAGPVRVRTRGTAYPLGVPSGAADDANPEPWPPPALAARLGFLLKHAQLRFAELSETALDPLETDGRELGVLTLLASEASLSQQQAARRLHIDRTTMVAFIDRLERKGLVERRPDRDDRRRNVIQLTDAGHKTLRKATKAVEEAEHQLLEPLGENGARQFKEALHVLVSSPEAP